MSCVRIGTSGWNYPPARARGTASSIRRAGPVEEAGGLRRARVLRRALRHGRGELDVLRPAAPDDARAWAERTPAGFEFSVKLYQKFTHPEMFKRKATGDQDPLPSARSDDADLDDVPPRHRSARVGGQARRAARAVSRQLQGRRRIARLSGMAAAALRGLSGRRRAAAQELERSIGDTLDAAERRSARRGCRSTSRSSGSRSGRTTCRT